VVACRRQARPAAVAAHARPLTTILRHPRRWLRRSLPLVPGLGRASSSKIELEAGSGRGNESNAQVDEVGLFFSGNFGRIELGQENGAEEVAQAPSPWLGYSAMRPGRARRQLLFSFVRLRQVSAHATPRRAVSARVWRS
jgi:hypothetical protein